MTRLIADGAPPRRTRRLPCSENTTSSPPAIRDPFDQLLYSAGRSDAHVGQFPARRLRGLHLGPVHLLRALSHRRAQCTGKRTSIGDPRYGEFDAERRRGSRGRQVPLFGPLAPARAAGGPVVPGPVLPARFRRPDPRGGGHHAAGGQDVPAALPSALPCAAQAGSGLLRSGPSRSLGRPPSVRQRQEGGHAGRGSWRRQLEAVRQIHDVLQLLPDQHGPQLVAPLAYRLGDDPDFLDAWACFPLTLPALVNLPKTDWTSSRDVEAVGVAAGDLETALCGISAVLCFNSKPWRSASSLRRFDNPDPTAPRILLMNADGPVSGVNRLTTAAFTIRSKASESVPIRSFHHVEMMGGFADDMMSHLTGSYAQEHGSRMKDRESYIRIGDDCDGCGKEAVAGEKLRKCSRCKVAHYCSAECQVAAWKRKEGGHKADCFVNGQSDAGELARGE